MTWTFEKNFKLLCDKRAFYDVPKSVFSAGKDNGSQSYGWLSNDGIAKNQWKNIFCLALTQKQCNEWI